MEALSFGAAKPPKMGWFKKQGPLYLKRKEDVG
jgi:hypothetical protein